MMDRRRAILEFWRACELFSPANVPRGGPSTNIYRQKPATALPWEHGHQHYRKKPFTNCVWQYTIYVGIFNSDRIQTIVDQVIGVDELVFDRFPGADSCLFGMVVNDSGLLLPQSLVISSFAWVASQTLSPGPNASSWLSGFEAFEARFQETIKGLDLDRSLTLSGEDEATEVEMLPVDWDFLSSAATTALQQLHLDSVFDDGLSIVIAARNVAVRNRNEVDSSDYLNSFYVSDLRRVSNAIADNEVGSGLKDYLADKIRPSERTDVRRDRHVVWERLAPNQFPNGRWPARGHFPLATGQQFAINELTRQFDTHNGLFAVNGPPGTGKTTLIRDIVASVVVDRAKVLASLPSCEDGFEGELTWHSGRFKRSVPNWNESLYGHELVVASSNNGAVENVSVEIPGLDAIDESWRDESDYFRQVSDGLRKHDKSWGLLAATLGNRKNCRDFAKRFWWEPHSDSGSQVVSMKDRLQALAKLSREARRTRWKQAVKKFQDSIRLERKIAAELQAEHRVCAELLDLKQKIRSLVDAVENLDANADMLRDKITRQNRILDEFVVESPENQARRAELMEMISEVESQRDSQVEILDARLERINKSMPSLIDAESTLCEQSALKDRLSRNVEDLEEQLANDRAESKLNQKKLADFQKEAMPLASKVKKHKLHLQTQQQNLEACETKVRELRAKRPSGLFWVLTLGEATSRWQRKLFEAEEQSRSVRGQVAHVIKQIRQLEDQMQKLRTRHSFDVVNSQAGILTGQVSDCERQLRLLRDPLNAASNRVVELRREIKELALRYSRQVEERVECQKDKESVLETVRNKRDALVRQIELLDSERDKRQSEKDQLSSNLKSIDRRLQEVERDCTQSEDLLAKFERRYSFLSRRIDSNTASWGNERPDPERWLDDYEWSQKVAPWAFRPWMDARARVFLAALELHQAYVECNASMFEKGLTAALDVIERKVPAELPESHLRAAWTTFFMVVPVVSTTFASMDRLFQGLGAESLGWSIIDEAGQATPQSAVGAIWRSQKTVVVGDPMQLQPICSVSKKIESALAKKFRVSEKWQPTKTSVQELADATSTVGTNLHCGEHDVWVGSPLTVHRRCESPMFDISNAVAYDGMMVYGTPERPPIDLPASCWFDIDEPFPEGHWSPAEGRKVSELVASLLARGVDKANIFLISPFRDCSFNLERIQRRFDLPECGTVHKAQGKEYMVVVFVLGGNPARKGARDWATESPNLVNVAVSRAQRRLYIVGNHRVWSRHRFIRECSKQLPIV